MSCECGLLQKTRAEKEVYIVNLNADDFRVSDAELSAQVHSRGKTKKIWYNWHINF